MKYILVLLLLIDPIKQLTKVAKINAAKKAAQQAYIAHDYKKAIDNYTILLDSLAVEDDIILLNLANAYHKVKDSANALSSYEVLTSSENKKVQSIAQQQLGVIQFKTKKYETALTYFKRALRANPNNSNARYNYELTKKIIDKKKEEEERKQQEEAMKKAMDKKGLSKEKSNEVMDEMKNKNGQKKESNQGGKQGNQKKRSDEAIKEMLKKAGMDNKMAEEILKEMKEQEKKMSDKKKMEKSKPKMKKDETSKKNIEKEDSKKNFEKENATESQTKNDKDEEKNALKKDNAKDKKMSPEEEKEFVKEMKKLKDENKVEEMKKLLEKAKMNQEEIDKILKDMKNNKNSNNKNKISNAINQNLQGINISPEKAVMILEAMRQQEVQYMQQGKKKSKTKGSNNTKPDW